MAKAQNSGSVWIIHLNFASVAILSAAFFVLSLVLAVLFGCQTSSWTWGPALLSLLIAAAAGTWVLLRQPSRMLNPVILVLGILTLGWFSFRAILSPVKEFGEADLMLLGGILGAFICVLAIQQCRRAHWTLTAGIAALLLANLVVMLIQKMNPGWRPLLANPTGATSITGFFFHYNYVANYLLISSIWLLGEAWNSRQRLVQIILGTLGTMGMAAIWWTGSRGGLLAASIALTCLGGVILIEAKRSKARWFPAAAIAMPFMALLVLGLLFNGWQDIQAAKGLDESSAHRGLFDNTVRLIYLGAAASAVLSHPLAGGGSQSFSWECFQFLDRNDIGIYRTKPEYVHNEWLQVATDYGLIGFGLLLGFLVAVGISAILRLCFEPKASSPKNRTDTMR
ncbi:MAG TPA: O-antigen ligase family protein, partial [Candidatus Obscuribacterales bacterium]